MNANALSLRSRFAGLIAAAALALAACGPAGAPAGGPALWKISDSDSEIWLFGSVHVLPRGLAWRSARMDAAFAAADTIVFEVDTGAEGRARLQRLFLERGYDRAGGPLSAKLAPADRARLARAAETLGVPLAAFEPMRPWFAAMQLSLLHLQSQGQTAESGVETVLEEEAARQNKARGYLESAEEQVGIFADLSAADELAFLIASLRQIEEDSSSAAEMDAAWARGDTRRLARLIHDQVDEAGPAVRAALIVERNRRWADAIEHMLDGEGRIFVAAGAAHFVGPDSVIALLRARGHTVEEP